MDTALSWRKVHSSLDSQGKGCCALPEQSWFCRVRAVKIVETTSYFSFLQQSRYDSDAHCLFSEEWSVISMQSLHWPSSLQWYDLGLGFKSDAVHAGAGRMLDHQISVQGGSSEITGISLQKACQGKRCCREHIFHAELERSPVSQVPVIKWNSHRLILPF